MNGKYEGERLYANGVEIRRGKNIGADVVWVGGTYVEGIFVLVGRGVTKRGWEVEMEGSLLA